MVVAIFALVGVMLGVFLTLFAKGELSIYKKHLKESASDVSGDEQNSSAKSEQQLMRQWQNLLSYGVENENETYI